MRQLSVSEVLCRSVADEALTQGCQQECKLTQWFGCYADSWKGWIVDEAFQHPAKFARGLIRRILEHGIERGYWQPGQLIGDPFGGVACGGVIAASLGFRWVGLELEAKFVEIGQKNIEAHRNWYAIGKPRPVLLRGDSRRFHEAIEAVEVAVTSPPFLTREDGGGIAQTGETTTNRLGRGALAIDAAISSPPYATIAAGQGGLNHLPAREDGQQSGRAKEGSQDADQRYGEDPGQIARLREGSIEAAVTSPPFTTDQPCASQTRLMNQGYESIKSEGKRDAVMVSEANIQTLKTESLDASVTSPPFEDKNACNDPKYTTGRTNSGGPLYGDYGNSDGQIGRESGETYWQAMAKVYASLFRALKPGGYAAIVVKDYVKGGKRVRLCVDTLRLLCHVGFVSVERAHAMLVEESGHHDMFSGAVKMKKERKSFFRRLAEKKGSPPIDYEEVLFVRKPFHTQPAGHAVSV